MHYEIGREHRHPISQGSPATGGDLTNACRIRGLGGYLPERILTNAELSATFGISEDWIISRTGIQERRILPAGMDTSDMGLHAARAALADSGMDPNRVTHLLLASCAPDGLVPSTACTLQHKLGMSGLVALDFNAACSGFLYGLYLSAAILRLEPKSVILLVAAEAMSRLCSPDDRNVNVLFGDGAGAAVITAEGTGGLVLRDVVLSSDGAHGGLLTANGGGSKAAYASPDSRVGEGYFLQMQGREVFKHAVKRMSESCLEILGRNGLTMDDVDVFVPHQANGRIIEAVGDRLKVAPGKTFMYLAHCGNTSAASIPLALNEAHRQGVFQPGRRVLLTGFGAGFTWGSALFDVPAK